MISAADDLDWCLAKRETPHDLMSNQIGAPDYECYEQLSASRLSDPSAIDFGIVYQGMLAGMVNLYPDHTSSRRAEIAYFVIPRYRGRQFGISAVRAAVLYSQENLGFTEITAEVSPGNTPSQRLLTKADFQCVDVNLDGFVYVYMYGRATDQSVTRLAA
jgi:RimJ/RimL family protein N-acetyltransferase